MGSTMKTWLGILAISIVAAAPAVAHPALVKAIPAAKSAVASPTVISVQFSEGLEAKFSSFDLIAADGHKIATAPVTLDGSKKTLSAAPASPLAAGAYKVAWRVVASDGHKVEGAYDFTVK
jgi:methionine-rich copper-binding protein CopC